MNRRRVSSDDFFGATPSFIAATVSLAKQCEADGVASDAIVGRMAPPGVVGIQTTISAGPRLALA